MSPPEGHAQGLGAPGPWREPRAGQWRTDASPGSRRRGPQTSPSAAAACACAVRLSGRMVAVSGTWRLCERIRVDPGFRGRGPVCHRCQRLSPLCPVALGDAVHLLWVVLERVSALCDVAKGSRVLPAERCLPCRRREPWPPPPCVREQVLQVAVEQHAVCCCRGPVAAAQPHPGQLCGLPCPSLCPGLADGCLLLRGGRGAEGGRPQCQGHVPLTCAGGRLQPSAFGGPGRCRPAPGLPVRGHRRRSVQGGFLFESAPLPPTFLGHDGATCLAVPALGCSPLPGTARISRRTEALSRGVGVVPTRLTAWSPRHREHSGEHRGSPEPPVGDGGRV